MKDELESSAETVQADSEILGKYKLNVTSRKKKKVNVDLSEGCL